MLFGIIRLSCWGGVFSGLSMFIGALASQIVLRFQQDLFSSTEWTTISRITDYAWCATASVLSSTTSGLHNSQLQQFSTPKSEDDCPVPGPLISLQNLHPYFMFAVRAPWFTLTTQRKLCGRRPRVVTASVPICSPCSANIIWHATPINFNTSFAKLSSIAPISTTNW